MKYYLTDYHCLFHGVLKMKYEGNDVYDIWKLLNLRKNLIRQNNRFFFITKNTNIEMLNLAIDIKDHIKDHIK